MHFEKIFTGDVFKGTFIWKFKWPKRPATQILFCSMQVPSKGENLGVLEWEKFVVQGHLTCVRSLDIPSGLLIAWMEALLFISPVLGESRLGSALSLWICLLDTEEGYGQWLSHRIECCPFHHWFTRRQASSLPLLMRLFCVYSGALAILTSFPHSTEINVCICECALRQGWQGSFLSSLGACPSLWWHWQHPWDCLSGINSSFLSVGLFLAGLKQTLGLSQLHSHLYSHPHLSPSC